MLDRRRKSIDKILKFVFLTFQRLSVQPMRRTQTILLCTPFLFPNALTKSTFTIELLSNRAKAGEVFSDHHLKQREVLKGARFLRGWLVLSSWVFNRKIRD